MKRHLFLPGLALLAAIALAVVVTGAAASPVTGSDVLYTTNADFDQGTLFNVNHDSPGVDQLQLNVVQTTLPVMWIANAGEDTVSKIDTNTGRELARYRTWFGPAGQPGYVNHLGDAYAGAAPSRTAVDVDGNVYVANRHFDGLQADVIKILAEGGIDRNGNGVIDTSIDTSADGVIQPGEMLPMADTNGNHHIDPSEIQDERIAWVVSVGPANGLGRSLAIDPGGNIWLGLFNAQQYWKVSSVDGHVLAGPVNVAPNTPYGSIVDGSGNLWGASLGTDLVKLNTNTLAVTHYNHGQYGADYGIAFGNGKVYLASQGGFSFVQFDPVTTLFSTPASTFFYSLGVAVDSLGNIYAGNAAAGGLAKFAPSGALIWSAPGQPGTAPPRGVVVDSNNDVWGVNFTSNNISKWRGTDGFPLGVFPVGNLPYTYTDATGLTVRTNTSPTGTWTATQDGGPGATWGTITWNTEPQGSEPPGTSITVEARAADTEAALPLQTWTPVSNGVGFTLAGRFIEVKATLHGGPDGVSPVLSDLRVQSAHQQIVAQGTAISSVEGAPFSGVVGSFDGGAWTTPADFTATVDWGDGSLPTSGTIVATGAGHFEVTGTHTYVEEGTYTALVTILETAYPVNTATATTTADVADAPLHATGVSLITTNPVSGVVANFTDENPYGTVSDFTATIDWGDGSPPVPGTVAAAGSGFTVSGTHAYAATGPYDVHVTIDDIGGQSATATSHVMLYAFAPGGGAFVVGNGSATGTVTFWGSQWSKLNVVGGGAAPSAFKGFAAVPSAPGCGIAWSTGPGNSPPPPAGPLPAYMGVIVSSSIDNAGSAIAGNTVHVVVVRTDPGYDANPGHPGTGTVVMQAC